MLLRVNADPGNVHIFTDESAQSFLSRARRSRLARARRGGFRAAIHSCRAANSLGVSLEGKLPWRTFRGQFGVSYEIHVPRRYNVEVHTLGGNIDVQDIDGQVDLFTEGGNIYGGPRGRWKRASSPASRRHAGSHWPQSLRDAGRPYHDRRCRRDLAGDHFRRTHYCRKHRRRRHSSHRRRTNSDGRISGVAALDTGRRQYHGVVQRRVRSRDSTPAGAFTKCAAASQLSSERRGHRRVYPARRWPRRSTRSSIGAAGTGLSRDASLPLKISDQDSASSSPDNPFAGDLNGGGEFFTEGRCREISF